MKVTTDHSSSSYGQPVILDDENNILDYSDGVKAVRNKLKMNTTQLGDVLNVSSRTVEDWEQGRRMPNAASLNMMGILLKKI
jgi:DNA-binding transcriptional regulator YiaG